MTILAHNAQATFTIEFPDGTIYTGAAHVVDMSISRGVLDIHEIDSTYRSFMNRTMTSAEITLSVCGEPELLMQATKREVAQEKKSDEWRCPYCRTLNIETAKRCGEGSGRSTCGASKPLAWELRE